MTVNVAQLEYQIHFVVRDIDDSLARQFHLFGGGKLLAEVALHPAILEGVVEHTGQEVNLDGSILAYRELHLNARHLQLREMATDIIDDLSSVAIKPDVDVTRNAQHRVRVE